MFLIAGENPKTPALGDSLAHSYIYIYILPEPPPIGSTSLDFKLLIMAASKPA